MPGRAAQLQADGLAAVAVLELDGAAVVGEPAVAPLHERHEGRDEVGALGRQPVAPAGALAGLAIVLPLEQPLGHELLEATGGGPVAPPPPLHPIAAPGRSPR